MSTYDFQDDPEDEAADKILVTLAAIWVGVVVFATLKHLYEFFIV